MKFIDRLLQHWRIDEASPYIARGAQVLDIGSADGALFQRMGKAIGASSMGIDPTLTASIRVDGMPLIAGNFPDDMPAAGPFDVITMLAVLEHIPAVAYDALRRGCQQFLKPGGNLIVTVPSAQVDRILALLKFLRLIDGMSLEEHHGFDVEQTTRIFCSPEFRLTHNHRFELGLNNLFVFQRGPAGEPGEAVKP